MVSIIGPKCAAGWVCDMTDHNIEFVNAAARTKAVPLDWPLTVDGQLVDCVTVRRLSGGEVGALQEAVAADGFQFETIIHHLVDQPDYVIAALDQDDQDRVAEAVFDFLPARMRAALETAQAEMEAALHQDMTEKSPTTDTPSAPSPDVSAGG